MNINLLCRLFLFIEVSLFVRGVIQLVSRLLPVFLMFTSRRLPLLLIPAKLSALEMLTQTTRQSPGVSSIRGVR